ncbi:MAG TPA: hypothetical protein VNV86_05750 [Candidatus Acidoferrum sp.]|nr:hypothetical protein [Candidatus Acidoferrum sp.]
MNQTRILPMLFCIMALLVPAARADLKAALAERDLGKRSKLALENAGSAIKAARAAFEKGENAKVESAAAEVRESVDLAYDSLKSTGKDARKSPKWFKHAEIETRDLLKKLDTLQRDLNFQDRAVLNETKTRVQQVHDELLLELMEGKKK